MIWRLLAAFALILSLGLKLSADHRAPGDDSRAALAEMAANLDVHGYVTSFDPAKQQVTAARQGCSLDLRLLDPHATKLSHFLHKLSATGPVHFVWRGQWHAELPRLRSLFQYYLLREWVRQGQAARRDPVWLVAAPRQCPLPPASALSVQVALVMPE